MSWGVYAVALWLLVGLEVGLRGVLRIGDTGVAPSFVLPLVVFVGLFARPRVSTTAALIAGLLIDLTSPVTLPGGGTAIIPGPNALGMVLASQLVLGVRGLVFLNSPVTLIVLTPLAGMVWQIVVTAAFGARELYDPIGFHAGSQLTQRLLGQCLDLIVAHLHQTSHPRRPRVRLRQEGQYLPYRLLAVPKVAAQVLGRCVYVLLLVAGVRHRNARLGGAPSLGRAALWITVRQALCAGERHLLWRN